MRTIHHRKLRSLHFTTPRPPPMSGSRKRPACPVPEPGAHVWVSPPNDNLLCTVCQELFTDVRP
jgi:hypothetical protein